MKLGAPSGNGPLYKFPRIEASFQQLTCWLRNREPPDDLIHQWAVSAWQAFSENRPVIEQLLQEHGISGVHSLR